MTKTLKIQSGYVDFTIEEMLSTFNQAIYKFAHICHDKLKNIEGNINTLEDYAQIGKIEAVAAFKTYDHTTNVLFLTYLTSALRIVYVHLVRDLNAKKRKTEKPLLYLNEQRFESGNEDRNSEVLINSGDVYFKEKSVSLEEFLKKRLTDEEKLYLAMELKKQVGKSSGNQKNALLYSIDVFTEEVDYQIDTKNNLAIHLGITRPTLNSRIKTTLIKAKKLSEEYMRIKCKCV